MVSLLLEHIALALPLPDEQLPRPRAAHPDPVPRPVEHYAADAVVRDAIKSRGKSLRCKFIVWNQIENSLPTAEFLSH